MIDNFSLLLTHSLLLLAAWRFLRMSDAGLDEATADRDADARWGKRR